VRAIDSAFLRHGRYDYVIPVGPPDAEARRAIWIRYLSSIPNDELDLDAVVSASSLFTPADIEFAARRTAQAVFEEALLEGGVESATTELVLSCIQDTRPTLTARIIEEFQQDIDDYARV
jgi:SpoVK/Ycf46/Vps4 family AAA+-type ATPase